MGNCTHNNSDWFITRHQISRIYYIRCWKRGAKFATTHWEVIRNWVPNYFQQLHWTVCCSDTEFVKQLYWRLDKNIYCSFLFSTSCFQIPSSLSVRDQVHVLYILIFKFLTADRHLKDSELNCSKNSPHLITGTQRLKMLYCPRPYLKF